MRLLCLPPQAGRVLYRGATPSSPRPCLPRCAGQDALRLWDAATGKCLAVFLHHKEPVTCAAWFPDGQRLVTGSHDKQVGWRRDALLQAGAAGVCCEPGQTRYPRPDVSGPLACAAEPATPALPCASFPGSSARVGMKPGALLTAPLPFPSRRHVFYSALHSDPGRQRGALLAHPAHTGSAGSQGWTLCAGAEERNLGRAGRGSRLRSAAAMPSGASPASLLPAASSTNCTFRAPSAPLLLTAGYLAGHHVPAQAACVPPADRPLTCVSSPLPAHPPPPCSTPGHHVRAQGSGVRPADRHRCASRSPCCLVGRVWARGRGAW